jgi:hypothetical protein
VRERVFARARSTAATAAQDVAAVSSSRLVIVVVVVSGVGACVCDAHVTPVRETTLVFALL